MASDLGNLEVTWPSIAAGWTEIGGVTFPGTDIAFNPDFIWVVVVGFVIAFILAFAVGANDVANSFGTSVGSKVLTLKQACVMAVIFESLGACLLGAHVSDTIWKEIVDVGLFVGQEKVLMLGEVSALLGTAVWLLVATLLKIPVSGTHAIVGSTMGFTFVKYGYRGIKWLKIVRIVASWFVSPVLAGGVSGFLFILIRRFILTSATPLESGLRALPVFYAITIFTNTISIFLGGTIREIPWWGALIISGGLALITAAVVYWGVVPWQRRTILSNIRRLKARTVVPIICAMNCSVATNLDMLDDGQSRCGSIDNLQTFGTSTTTLDMLGDAEKMYEEEGEEKEKGNGTNGICYTVTVDQECQVEDEEEEVEEEKSNNLEPPPRKYHRLSFAYQQAHGLNPEPIQRETEFVNLADRPRNERDLYREDVYRPVQKLRTPSVYQNPMNKIKFHDEIAEEEEKEKAERTKLKRRDTAYPRSRVKGNWFVRCWKNIRTLGHADIEDSKKVLQKDDPPEIAAIFSFLQILTATFTAFAHGGNDVSNAIGPLVAIWVIFSNGFVPEQSSTPIWLLLFGGFGISVGLCVLGRKVIETVGSSLAIIIPSSGFCIGLGTACTVLVCSKIGLPVSTTHCIVGSVVAVGWLRSRKAVNWKVFGNIMACALVTLPVAAAFGAASMALLCLLP